MTRSAAIVEENPSVAKQLLGKCLMRPGRAARPSRPRTDARRKHALERRRSSRKTGRLPGARPARSDIYLVEGDSNALASRAGTGRTRCDSAAASAARCSTPKKARFLFMLQNEDRCDHHRPARHGDRSGDQESSRLRYHKVIIMIELGDVDGPYPT